MSPSNPDRCRIALHAGTAQVDLELPTGVPVAALIPEITDIATAPRPGARYLLHRPGLPVLDGAKTLAQHGIRDGTVLVLTDGAPAPPAPRFDDAGEQVAAAMRATVPGLSPRAGRLAAALAGTGLAGVAGFVAVPGGPGAPNALLAAAAAGAVAVLTAQFTGAGGPALTAVCGLAVLSVAVALAVELTGISLPALGALVAGAALGVLATAARIAVAVTGLPRRPGPPSADLDARQHRASQLLAGLVVTGSVAAAVGAGGAAGGRSAAGVGFATAVGLGLLLAARRHRDRVPIAALITGGVTTLGAALLAGAAGAPQQRLWFAAAAAALAAAALGAGFQPGPSAAARRGAELLEFAVLAAVLPLAGWVCGWFDTVRALSLG